MRSTGVRTKLDVKPATIPAAELSGNVKTSVMLQELTFSSCENSVRPEANRVPFE